MIYCGEILKVYVMVQMYWTTVDREEDDTSVQCLESQKMLKFALKREREAFWCLVVRNPA